MKKVLIWIVVVIVLYIVWINSAIFFANKINKDFIASKTWDERLCLDWIMKLKWDEQVFFRTMEKTIWEKNNLEIIGWECSYKGKDVEYFCLRDLNLNKWFYQVSLWGEIIFEDFSRLSEEAPQEEDDEPLIPILEVDDSWLNPRMWTQEIQSI